MGPLILASPSKRRGEVTGKPSRIGRDRTYTFPLRGRKEGDDKAGKGSSRGRGMRNATKWIPAFAGMTTRFLDWDTASKEGRARERKGFNLPRPYNSS